MYRSVFRSYFKNDFAKLIIFLRLPWGCFLYKGYAFRGFSSCPPFLEYQRFVNFATEKQPDIELFLWTVLFILRYSLEWWFTLFLQAKTRYAVGIIRTQHRNRTSNTVWQNDITYFPRKYREAIEIQKHPNNLNRNNGYDINKIWKTILPIIEDQPIPPFLLPSSHNFLLPLPLHKQHNIKRTIRRNSSVLGCSL